VDLVEVDVVDAEVAEALVHAAAQELGARVPLDAVSDLAQPALRGEHEIVAPRPQLAAQRVAEQLLRAPKPYPWAVSKKLIPSSSARRIAAVLSRSSVEPHSPPNCHVPKQMRDTRSPLRPSVTWSMARILARGPRD
jgi:hypothetical protein